MQERLMSMLRGKNHPVVRMLVGAALVSAAMKNKGARRIVFSVAGLIPLIQSGLSRINLSELGVEAGQTA